MLRVPFRLLDSSLLLTGMALALAACSGDTSGPGGVPPLTQAEATVIAGEMQDEMAGITDGSSLAELLSPTFTVAPSAARIGGSARLVRPPNCPTFSEFPPTDADHDNVPDNLTISFTLPACHFGGPVGTAYHELSGSVTISDPSVVDPGVRVNFADLLARTVAFPHDSVPTDSIYVLRRVNGVWQLLASASGFSATDSTTASHESSQHGTAQLAKAWQVDFVADSGETFVPDHRLPSGNLTVNGTTTRTAGPEVKGFSLTTVTPLHYDATCASADRITAGELHIFYSSPRGTATVTLVFTACGVDPTVTLVTAPVA